MRHNEEMRQIDKGDFSSTKEQVSLSYTALMTEGKAARARRRLPKMSKEDKEKFFERVFPEKTVFSAFKEDGHD